MMQCLLDMDGVLVDFTAAVEKRYGVKITCWDFDETLPVSKTKFWKSCDEGFWAGLDWTPDGREILQLVENAFGKENVCLLTSPCKTRGCLQGKMDWVMKHLPEYEDEDRCLMGRGKSFCAAPNRVLVDDSTKNVQKFMTAGGNAILVARPWNTLAGIDPINHIKKWLEIYLGEKR